LWAPSIDKMIREMDDEVDENYEKMKQQIAQEIYESQTQKHLKGSVKPKKPLTDEELVKLFGQDYFENPEKKKDGKKKESEKKLKNTKKRNGGKNENAIRKSQKPVKL
jgi:hypothetical protein